MISFISLFFAPMISVMIYYRRGKMELTFSPLFVFIYGKSCCVNCILACLVKMLFTAVLGKTVNIGSTIFLIISILIALASPYVFEYLGKMLHIECEIKNG